MYMQDTHAHAHKLKHTAPNHTAFVHARARPRALLGARGRRCGRSWLGAGVRCVRAGALMWRAGRKKSLLVRVQFAVAHFRALLKGSQERGTVAMPF